MPGFDLADQAVALAARGGQGIKDFTVSLQRDIDALERRRVDRMNADRGDTLAQRCVCGAHGFRRRRIIGGDEPLNF